jgi:DNA-binding MarR family transcriptional regulator
VDRLSRLLPRLCRVMVRQESDCVTRGELTLPQLWALERLHRQGPLHMHDLLTALQLKASTGTIFVDRLCRMKLVRRQRDAANRRAVRVAITRRGDRVLDEINATRRRALQHVFSHLSVAERRQYLTIIEKLAHQLSDEKDTL